MRPIRTIHSNLHLLGDPVGGSVGDLHAEAFPAGRWVRSVWQPTSVERAKIAAGANLAVFIGVSPDHHPPISIEATTDVERDDDAAAARILESASR